MALSSAVEISALVNRLGPEKRSCIVDDGIPKSVGESAPVRERDLRVSRMSLHW